MPVMIKIMATNKTCDKSWRVFWCVCWWWIDLCQSDRYLFASSSQHVTLPIT